MKIFLKFENPSFVSTGSNFDILTIKVLNESNFKSLNGNFLMDLQING
jgi:hypothetical protein